jgi:hypothetical protein
VTAEPRQPEPDAERLDPRARARARSEAKSQAVRDALEPLAPGERPLAVTIAAIAAAVMFVANIAAYVFSDHASGPDQSREIFQTALLCVVLGAAAWGMWRAKYWAVLGFQTILGLQVIFLALALTRATSALLVVIFLAVIALSSVLFWYLIRAMARIQMPESPTEKALRELREREETEESDG